MPRLIVLRSIAFALLMAHCSKLSAEERSFTFKKTPSELQVQFAGTPLASYVFADSKIPRPFFTHVRLPEGPQLTRNHPPQPADAQDHDLLHPGIWFALGDINGSDNWRLKAKVIGGEFVVDPKNGSPEASFTVRNQYLSNDAGQTLLTEDCNYRFLSQPWGTLCITDSKLTARIDCRFGDGMEEMGLGVRLATPIAVKSNLGGRILNSEGRIGEKETRERLADWCDYSGKIDNRPVGITLFAAPDNPRRTWWHNRDYGFFAANPFHAHPDRADNSPLVLKPGESVRFRFGIALHADRDAAPYDPAQAWQTFQQQLVAK